MFKSCIKYIIIQLYGNEHFSLYSGIDDKYFICYMLFQVIERLLSIPNKYWSHFAYPDNTDLDDANQKGNSSSLHNQFENRLTSLIYHI